MKELHGIIKEAEQANKMPINPKQLDDARKSGLASMLEELKKQTNLNNNKIRKSFLKIVLDYLSEDYDVKPYWDEYKKVLIEKLQIRMNPVSETHWEDVVGEMKTKYNIIVYLFNLGTFI